MFSDTGKILPDFERLERLIREASPGPWETREADGLAAILTAAGWLEDQTGEQDVKNARFIAGFNPVVARQLLDLARRALVLDAHHGSYEVTVFEAWLGAWGRDAIITRLERDQMLDAWLARAALVDAYDDEAAAFQTWFAVDQAMDGCRGTGPEERQQMLEAWLARAGVARREKSFGSKGRRGRG
jgi:hypothetical protein